MIKRIICVILCVMLILSFTACRGKAAKPTEETVLQKMTPLYTAYNDSKYYEYMLYDSFCTTELDSSSPYKTYKEMYDAAKERFEERKKDNPQLDCEKFKILNGQNLIKEFVPAEMVIIYSNSDKIVQLFRYAEGITISVSYYYDKKNAKVKYSSNHMLSDREKEHIEDYNGSYVTFVGKGNYGAMTNYTVSFITSLYDTCEFINEVDGFGFAYSYKHYVVEYNFCDVRQYSKSEVYKKLVEKYVSESGAEILYKRFIFVLENIGIRFED